MLPFGHVFSEIGLLDPLELLVEIWPQAMWIMELLLTGDCSREVKFF